MSVNICGVNLDVVNEAGDQQKALKQEIGIGVYDERTSRFPGDV